MTTRHLTALSLLVVVLGACTIEQDLTPLVESGAAADPNDTDPNDTGPNGAESEDIDTATTPPRPGDDPTGASEEPAEQPSDDEPVSDEPTSEPQAGNTAPTAADDRAATDEDTVVHVDVLRNDDDPDGDPLAVRLLSNPSHGTASVEGADIRFVPGRDQTTEVAFDYAIDDGRGGGDRATVRIGIRPVNDTPVATDDRATTPEDTAVTLNVLQNDSDVDGDSLKIGSVGQVSRGRASIVDGRIRYVPPPDYAGEVTFTYTAVDPAGASDSATVTVVIGGTNDPPQTRSDMVTTREDSSILIDVLANDSDPDGDTLSLVSVTQPSRGTTAIESGRVRFTPAPDSSGQERFTYVIEDPSGEADQGSVVVTVEPVNDRPVARADSATTVEDTAVTINVLGNDSDVDGDTLTVASAGAPANGSATVVTGGVRYAPNQGFVGTDQFTYTVSDGNGGTAQATVTVVVESGNAAPTAAGDSGLVQYGGTVELNLVANDSDPDGDALRYELTSSPGQGTLTRLSDGSVRYTHSGTRQTTFVARDSFQYEAVDPDGARSNAVTVTIEINRAPNAVADGATFQTNFNVITGANTDNGTKDSDPDGDALTLVSHGQMSAGSGSLSCSSNGNCTYTPPSSCGATVDEAVTYTISDGRGGQDTATIRIRWSVIC